MALLHKVKKTICFFLLNKKGERFSSFLYPQIPEIVKLSFRWKGHLPVIPITRDGIILYFGIDSGEPNFSKSNYMFHKLPLQILAYYTNPNQ